NVTERLVVRALKGLVSPDDLPEEVQHTRQEPASVEATSGSASVTVAQPSLPAMSPAADVLWRRLSQGESFWTAVYEPFKAHDLTRADLRALVDRGLTETRGSYRKLLALFQMPASDYKRFLAFLYQFNGNLPVQRYRTGRMHDDHEESQEASG